MQPDQADFLLQTVYLPSLKSEQRLTQKVIEAIPLDKGDYSPDDISQSALDLAWHIVATEMRFLDAVAKGAFDFSPRPMPDTVHTSADLVQWYKDNFEAQVNAITVLSGEQLAKVVDFRGMFQMPAVEFVGFVIKHSVHHRGQLSMYLRPMGAKVPSIYGESYDAKLARIAAQAASA